MKHGLNLWKRICDQVRSDRQKYDNNIDRVHLDRRHSLKMILAALLPIVSILSHLGFFIPFYQVPQPYFMTAFAVIIVITVSAFIFRGSTATDAYNWPTGREIDPDSYLGKMRALTGLALDLPTEAQREFACRAGTSGAFCDNSANGLNVGWGIDNGEGKGLMPVGLKTPNSWGLYELHGNAMEWTLDRWGTLPEDAQVNPEGPTDASGSYRVLKGAHTGENLIVKGRSASRTQGNASQNYYNKGYTGVRVVCPITVPAAE